MNEVEIEMTEAEAQKLLYGKRIFSVTSKLNIGLHALIIVVFAYFAFLGGNTFFGGIMATLALFILVDMGACVWARIKELL